GAAVRDRLDQRPHPAGLGDAARRLQAVGLRQGSLRLLARGLHPDQARDGEARLSSRRRSRVARDVGGFARSRAGVSFLRIESRAFAVSWAPSDAVAGAANRPFRVNVARPDEPPPDRLDDPYGLVRDGAARQVNDLRAWIELDDEGWISDFGYAAGDGGDWEQLEFPAVRREPELDGDTVRFVQSSGGR